MCVSICVRERPLSLCGLAAGGTFICCLAVKPAPTMVVVFVRACVCTDVFAAGWQHAHSWSCLAVLGKHRVSLGFESVLSCDWHGCGAVCCVLWPCAAATLRSGEACALCLSVPFRCAPPSCVLFCSCDPGYVTPLVHIPCLWHVHTNKQYGSCCCLLCSHVPKPHVCTAPRDPPTNQL